MKTQRGVLVKDADELRKAKRLEPMHKSGKERHSIYLAIEDEDEEAKFAPKRESVLDYLEEEEE